MRYTVGYVDPNVKTRDGKFGPMKTYRVKFAESSETVDVMSSAKTPAPQEGSILNGEIVEGQYGFYFKKDPNQGWQKGYKDYTARVTKDENRQPVRPDNYSMFVSYAKDLMINYMNTINWDFSKIDYDSFNTMVDLVTSTSDRLSKDEATSATKDDIKDTRNAEIFDPFTARIEDL